MGVGVGGNVMAVGVGWAVSDEQARAVPAMRHSRASSMDMYMDEAWSWAPPSYVKEGAGASVMEGPPPRLCPPERWVERAGG